MTLRASGSDYRTSRGLEETEIPVLEGTNRILHIPRPRREEQWRHRRLNQNYLLVLEGLLWRHGSAGAHHRDGALEGPPWCRSCRLQGWVASGQTTTRRVCNPTHQQIIVLSKALPTRARPSFYHHQSLPSRSLHKPLSLLHQRAERRSKKKHSLTEAKTKITLQKVNHEEKAEGYVPDEGTR